MGQYRERQPSNTLESGKWRSGGGSASASLLGRKKVSTVTSDLVVYLCRKWSSFTYDDVSPLLVLGDTDTTLPHHSDEE